MFGFYESLICYLKIYCQYNQSSNIVKYITAIKEKINRKVVHNIFDWVMNTIELDRIQNKLKSEAIVFKTAALLEQLVIKAVC